MQHHNQQLRSSVDAVLGTASTVHGLGSTRADGSQHIPDTFSMFGVPLGDAKEAAIEEWAQSVESDGKEFESSGASSDLSMRTSTPTGQNSKIVKGPQSKADNDFDVYIVKQILEKAEQKFFKADYAEAEKSFQLGMDGVSKLPPTKQKVFDLRDVSLKIAFSRLQYVGYAHLWEEVENQFKSLLESLSTPKRFLEIIFGRAPDTAERISFKSYAYFSLAQVYLCTSSRTDAELMCQKRNDLWNAATGGEVDPLRSEGLHLMALIHEAKGDSSSASIFFELAVAEGFDANETTP